VTMGIVSALGRDGTHLTEYENFIQTDASINPGNSGGALVDTQGRLIGINAAIFSRSGGNQGIGFAVPANLAHSVMEGIMKYGRVTRGFLGIGLQSLTDEVAKQLKLNSTTGAVVTQVETNSPADKAGILPYDVVIGVNGKEVEGPTELRMRVAAIAPGTKVDVKLWRDGKEKTVSVTLVERPSQNVASANPSAVEEDPDVLDGVTVGDLDSELRKQFDIPESVQKGVVVTKVDPDSPSADAGIRPGDVIMEIDRKAVADAKQAVEMSEKLKKERKVLLRVSSKGASRLVVVERND
jgi:serine protease Do